MDITETLWNLPQAVPTGLPFKKEEKEDGDTEIDVVSGEQVDLDLSEHGVVLNKGLSHWWAVVGNKNELSLAISDGFEGGFGSKGNLATLHDEGELGVDVFLGGFLDHFVFGFIAR